jgi:hypothetical protein
MDTVPVVIPRERALELYRTYKKHVHYSQPIDRECLRAYQLLAKGRLVIKALESIKLAGLNAMKLPKLAIAMAGAETVDCRMDANGECSMDSRPGYRSYKASDERRWIVQRCYVHFPRGSFSDATNNWRATALVPGIPLHLRPRRGLQNYHILWEAEWTRIVPHDPMLLRRLGKGDLWVVVAQWDLTEVERAALATRL